MKAPQLFRFTVGEPDDEDWFDVDIVAFSLTEAVALFVAREPDVTPDRVEWMGEIDVIHPDVIKTLVAQEPYR